MTRFFLITLFAFILSTPVGAQMTSQTTIAQGPVDQVIDARTVRMGDGTLVTLAGIDIPGAETIPTGPLAVAAYTLLTKETKGRTYNIQQGDAQTVRTDRYGHTLALVVDSKSGQSLQEKLLAAGLARVWDGDDTGLDMTPFLAAEAAARAAQPGQGQEKSEQGTFTPDALPITAIDRITHVTGTVASAITKDNDIFLALTTKGTQGFYIRIPAGARQGLLSAGVDPMAMNGHVVYVRGLTRLKDNTPFIDVIRAWQLQDISLPPPTSPPAISDTASGAAARAAPPSPPTPQARQAIEEKDKQDVILTN